VDYRIENNLLEAPKQAVINTLDQTAQIVRGDLQAAIEPSLREVARPRNLRTHFRSVGRMAGALLLETDRGHVVALRLNSKYEGFTLESLPSVDQFRLAMRAFSPLPVTPPGVGYRLSVAKFADGSEVYLDSRGLLHLKSSDRQIPEATFVMHDEEAAGWCADGRMWGQPYFLLGSTPAVPAAEIQESILTPFTSRLS
jgi:hypothetical protein